jgi:hypothetical protein
MPVPVWSSGLDCPVGCLPRLMPVPIVPLRETRRAGRGALPARTARTAGSGRVRPVRQGCPRRNPEDDTMRQRPRRNARGPLAGMGARKQEKAARKRAGATPPGTKPARRPPICAERGGCATTAYPADCPKRAFELPTPFRAPSGGDGRTVQPRSTDGCAPYSVGIIHPA